MFLSVFTTVDGSKMSKTKELTEYSSVQVVQQFRTCIPAPRKRTVNVNKKSTLKQTQKIL